LTWFLATYLECKRGKNGKRRIRWVDMYTRAFEDEESLSGNKTQPYATTPM